MTMIHEQTHQARSNVWSDLLMLIKPSITFMAVFTALGGMWLAPMDISISRALLTLLGTALIVGAANTLNCYLERESDKLMTRTKSRPLPGGRMKPATALYLGLVLSALALPILYLFASPMTAGLAAFALVAYVWVYTPMKQVSSWALIVGSVPGAMPPLLGWTAATETIDGAGLALFGILFIWQLPHFIAISMYRQSEYDNAGIKTVASQLGLTMAKWQILLWTTALVVVSLSLVPLNVAGLLYLVAASILGVAFMWIALLGFRTKQPNRWARNVFLYSLVYMNLMVVALAVDHQFGFALVS